MDLLWAITENLGDWTVVRKRLNEEFQRKQSTPLASTGFDLTGDSRQIGPGYFEELATRFAMHDTIGW